MPSASFTKFESNLLVDVNRLIESHESLNRTGPGRRGLGHITRSAVLMLCAAWELYIEELACEAVEYMCERVPGPRDLPRDVRKALAKHVKEAKNQLKPLELAGEGWKQVYKDSVRLLAAGLNTPKSGPVDKLLQLSIGYASISDTWSEGAVNINTFVGARGDIAHRGRDTAYVTIRSLKQYKQSIETTVLETDNTVAIHLRDSTPGQAMPWRRRL